MATRHIQACFATFYSAKQGPGFFYPATVLADAPEDAPCLREEIFGPVVVVNRFTDEADGLAKANGVPYGLAGSVWTSNVQR